MSVRLFDIPQRKNSTVTSTNGNMCPTGNTGCFLSAAYVVLPPIDVETCMNQPFLKQLPLQTVVLNLNHNLPELRRVRVPFTEHTRRLFHRHHRAHRILHREPARLKHANHLAKVSWKRIARTKNV